MTTIDVTPCNDEFKSLKGLLNIVNDQAPQDLPVTIYLLSLVSLLGDAAVSGVHMGLEQLVLSKGSCTYCTLVRQVGRFQRLVVILGNVVQQLPLVHL